MKIILAFLLICGFILTSVPVDAQNIGLPRKLQGTGRGFIIQQDSGSNLKTLLTNSTILLFSIGGIAFIIMMLWGAVDWIMSGGDKEKVAGARKKMTHALIGLVLLSLSFVIIRVIGQIVGFNPLETIRINRLNE